MAITLEDEARIRAEKLEKKNRERLEKFAEGLRKVDSLGSPSGNPMASTQQEFKEFCESHLKKTMKDAPWVEVND